MTTPDREILDAIAALPEAGGWLFTVVSTWGASPRPAGSLLLIDAAGRETGSVSGGCVEADLVEQVRAGALDREAARLLVYGVDRDQAARFGLPCGGRLEILAEPVSADAQWQRLREQVAARTTRERRLCLRTGEASLHAPGPEPFVYRPGETLARTFGPAWQLVIIGAGHIARYLAPIAISLGYRVVICDPRADQRAAWDLPDTELDPGMPDDVARARADDPRSALVALTHDPKLDDLALMDALTGRAFYVGALGSRRTQAARRERLLSLGLTPEQVARLHGPVGLDLGSRTPPEIAVAIAAELVAERNRRSDT